jgi:DNA invertase Pin-like site-specific DNA recombinase
MLIGYARTSTIKQDAGLCAQLALLERAGCDRENIFNEQVSSVEPRAQLDAAIRSLRKGDVLIVTKLDRFARSLEHAIALERKIAGKGASLQVLDPAMDTSQPMGRLLFNMLGAVAQFEREIMLERQREGIAKAQREGKYKGRQPTARAKADQVLELKAQQLGASEIARQLKIGRASVYRILKDAA